MVSAMKTIEYRFLDKSEWGDGPWQSEPDKIQWPDERTGLPCLILRHPKHGGLCGYVGVAEGHPYFGMDAETINSRVMSAQVIDYADLCSDDGDQHGICHVVEDGENDRVWWMGFSCAFSWGSLLPLYTAPALINAGAPAPPKSYHYRSVPYVRQQVTLLAAEVHRAHSHHQDHISR